MKYNDFMNDFMICFLMNQWNFNVTCIALPRCRPIALPYDVCPHHCLFEQTTDDLLMCNI